MPFLAIFRKDKDRDSSRSKTPVPQSPTPASISSRKSLSFSRARPSFTSSRSCTSPPPQLASISPASDFDYVLPDIEGSPAPEPEKELAQVPEEPPVSPVKLKRALPFGRRRGSASSGVIVAAVASGATVANAPRPFSEALDSFMTRKQQQTPDLDRPRDGEAHAPTPLASNSNPESITRQNVNSPATRHTTTLEDLDSADDDDDPLVPPPPRASVFGGYAYSDKDVPARSQSLPDIDRENSDSEMVRSESGHSRPPRPQVHPHQLARGKNKSVDLNSLLASPSNLLGSSSAASDTAAAPIKTKQKDASTKSSGGLFSWRSNKSSKEVPTVAPIVTADPADSSFSLKSFRHVGPASIPSSPVGQTGSVMGSSTNVNTAGISANNTTNTTTTAIVSSPPSSYGRASPALGTRPVPGRTGVTRERVNSTGSEGVMTAGLFRQAARRSNTNLVEEAGPASPRSSVTGIRDREKRGPPTRSWDVRDKDGDQSTSGSERVSAPVRGGGATSDRSALGVGGKPRTLGRSSSAMPSVGGESSPESPSPFAAALSKLGEEDPLTRSGYEGGGARLDYARYGVRSEGAVRSVSAAAVPASRPTQPRPSIHGINVRPEMRGVNARPMPQSASASPQSAVSRPSPPGPQSSIPRPGPQGINSSRPGPQSATSQRPGPQSANSVPAPQRPGPQSAHSRPSLPNARSSSPTKPRQSAPTAMGRSPPIRTTIPTKTNDGPSIKPRATSPVRMMNSRPPSPARSTRSNRSVPASPTRSIASSPTKSIMSKSMMASSPTKSVPGLPIKSSMRRPSVDTTGPSGGHSRYASVDTYRAKSPSADMYRAKSPSVDMTRAKSPAPSHMSRAKSPAPSNLSRSGAKSPGPGPAPRTGYVPPPRQSSLARPMDLVDSDEDESEDPEVESEEELGYGTRPGEKKATESEVGALRGRGSGSSSSPFASRQGSSTGHDGLTRERTITQRTAGSGRGSPSRDDDRPPKPPPKVGVSLFDRPVPSSSVSSLSSSPFDKFGTPPSSGTPPSRGRASHSTSAISAAATARNSAAIAEANRRLGVHSRGASSTSTTPGRSSHIRSPAEATDTDEDEDDKSETDSEDNAPLSSIVPPRRPGSAASNAPRPGSAASNAPPMVRSFGRAQKPLVDLSSGPNGPPPPRPPRRVPGVGVTRNSSLRGSRSVEDLGRMTMAPGSAVVGATGRPGPRPFAASPPSSTGDSNSSKAPVTPRDGSEAGGRRVVGASSLGPAGDEARRKERRRSEAKASVELGNVINGPGVLDDDDEDGEHMSAQMHGGMSMMGWGQQGLYPQMTGYQGFPVSQSMPSMSFPGQFPASQSMPFIPPPPPPGASEQYVAAHQQAMMMAKQAYLSAVAQQAMMFATEQWERSSNAGGSVYGGSQMGGGGMMGMPMMGMYANSAYASSMYEGSVIGGGGSGGWGSASAYGGGARSVYGGGGAGAKSEYGGGMKSSPTKSNAGGPGRSRLRAQTTTAEVPSSANRGNPVPPSTWTTRRKASPPGRYQ